MRFLMIPGVLTFLLAQSSFALAQQKNSASVNDAKSIPPPANVSAAQKNKTGEAPSSLAPESNGPSLEATTRFLLEKIGEGIPERNRISLTFGDGHTGFVIGGRPSIDIAVGTCHVGEGDSSWFLKDVRSVSVRNYVDVENELSAQKGERANLSSTVPEFFYVVVRLAKGKGAKVGYTSGGSDSLRWLLDQPQTFLMPDRDLAERVAKALNHAAELCGAGANEPF